ncbi:MAG TPA: hypothetical protein VIY54_08370 [Steroidobacteraceae bacterium]
MNSRMRTTFFATCALIVTGAWTVPALAQAAEVSEKPPMYTYVSDWVFPRAQWTEIEKSRGGTTKVFEKALSGSSLIGYGDDLTLVHQPDGSTHDTWWSSMSMAGLLNVLDEIHKAGGATTPALNSATKHWDEVFVSRFYNWRAGSYTGAYTHTSSYKLKADAPDDAMESLSKSFIVPMMEKLLADGTIVEYEIDQQAVHTQAPGMFLIVYISQNAGGVDKVNAALQQSLKTNPFAGPAFGSMIDFAEHRDELARTNATYK